MKRIGNLYNKICSINNLLLADKKASRGKNKQFGVIEHKKDRIGNLLKLQEQLINKTYKTSEYHIFTIREPKERTIHRLPYIDRIVHHAILNVIKDILFKSFSNDSYSCIPKKGVHLASYRLRNILKQGGILPKT